MADPARQSWIVRRQPGVRVGLKRDPQGLAWRASAFPEIAFIAITEYSMAVPDRRAGYRPAGSLVDLACGARWRDLGCIGLIVKELRQAIQRWDPDGPSLDLGQSSTGQLMKLAREGLRTDVETGCDQRLRGRQNHRHVIRVVGAVAAPLLDQEVREALTCRHETTGFKISNESMHVGGIQLQQHPAHLRPLGDGDLDALATNDEETAVADRLGKHRTGLIEENCREPEGPPGQEDIEDAFGAQRRDDRQFDATRQETLKTARETAFFADDLAPRDRADLAAAGKVARRLFVEFRERLDRSQVREKAQRPVDVIHRSECIRPRDRNKWHTPERDEVDLPLWW